MHNCNFLLAQDMEDHMDSVMSFLQQNRSRSPSLACICICNSYRVIALLRYLRNATLCLWRPVCIPFIFKSTISNSLKAKFV